MDYHSHQHSHIARTYSIYRVDLANCNAKYVLAVNLEDAAWQAYRLSKELNKTLVNVILDGKA